MSLNQTTKTAWTERACDHAADYIIRFVDNPAVERIVAQFDSRYVHIQLPAQRLDRLAYIAAKYWDFRKGRERFEVVADEPMNRQGSDLGNIVLTGATHMGMASRSSATLNHYAMVAVLGGANRSPYYRLRYALEQNITYDKLIFLSCEREVLPPEQAQAADYAPNARTEYDLSKGAIKTLLGTELVHSKEYETTNPEWRIAHFQKNDGMPILVLSAPSYSGAKRAHTSDTYRFLLQAEGENIGLGDDILFVTSAIYRYAQYFDALRDIILKTGANVETIGYEPTYGRMEVKPSQFLQELKSAIDAATRLRNAMKEYGYGEVLNTSSGSGVKSSNGSK